MKISLMTSGFQNKIDRGALDEDKFLADLIAAGITGIETATDNYTASPEAWKRFIAKAAAVGMLFPCMDAGVNMIGDGTDACMERAQREAEKSFELAASIGCPTVMLYSTMPAPGMGLEEARILYGKLVARAIVKAKSLGIAVCLEDFGVNPIFTAAARDCRVVLDNAGPDVKFTFDNGNFVYADDIPPRAFHLVKDFIWHAHIKDVTYSDHTGEVKHASPHGHVLKECLPGTGVAEIAACLKLLHGIGYKNWLSCEIGGGNVENAVEMAKFIRANW